MAKRFNVVTSKKYEQNGEEKTQWMNVGKLVKFEATADKPEGFILELYMFPHTKFSIFEEKKREDQEEKTFNSVPSNPVKEKEIEYPTEEVNIDDIPF